jgi:hypothetical protein
MGILEMAIMAIPAIPVIMEASSIKHSKGDPMREITSKHHNLQKYQKNCKCRTNLINHQNNTPTLWRDKPTK